MMTLCMTLQLILYYTTPADDKGATITTHVAAGGDEDKSRPGVLLPLGSCQYRAPWPRAIAPPKGPSAGNEFRAKDAPTQPAR
jgi:hypothetical protein